MMRMTFAWSSLKRPHKRKTSKKKKPEGKVRSNEEKERKKNKKKKRSGNSVKHPLLRGEGA